MSDTDDTTEEATTDDYSDDVGLAGTAVGVTRLDGTETPGIIRGTEDIEVSGRTLATRVVVEVEDADLPVNTAADRVEVI
ncbi:hypothetical protein ABNG03_00145 [Halorubrum sp. RMP-47]|uniref:Uncharacterized protein n=1 Tax=Halorubrum miltondacostae TaxID=3076378 RepID=A0ABD5M3X4_9EURY